MSRRNQGEMQKENGPADSLSAVCLVENFDLIINLELIWLLCYKKERNTGGSEPLPDF